MPFDQNLADRLRVLLLPRGGYDEKRMFGGIGFLLHGHMACGIVRDRLIVRVGAKAYAEALTLPHVTPFDLTGRPMTGWVQVAPEGWRRQTDLAAWVERGAACALALPAKGKMG